MAVYDKTGLLQRLVQMIRSAGIGGKTSAQNTRDFLSDLIDTMFSLFSGSGETTGPDLEWNAETVYNTTDNQFAISRLRIFKSKINNNTGHEPPYVPDLDGIYQDNYWVEVSSAPKAVIPSWKAGVFQVNSNGDPIIVFNAGVLYYLSDTVVLPFESTNFAMELAAEKWISLGGESGGPAVAAKYATWALLLADQAKQKAGYVYFATDASGFSTVDSGYAYFEYLGTTSGNESDYRKLTEGESMDLDLSWKLDASKVKTALNDSDDEIPTSKAVLEGTPQVTQVVKDSMTVGETYAFTVVKDAQGNVSYSAGISLVDKIAADTIKNLLLPGAAWSKDKIILIGENFNGELGRSGQEVFVLDVSNNLVFNGACVSATAGTSGGENGSATWVRIRGNDCLNPNDSRDLAVIAQLENENGWNTENNMKIITARWWIGGFYTSDSGYFYVCYNEIGQNWYVKRIGQPSADFYQISDAALIAEIEAHDFTVTPILQPLASEKGKDRQEYYWENPAGTPHITKCVKNGSTYKWIKLK